MPEERHDQAVCYRRAMAGGGVPVGFLSFDKTGLRAFPLVMPKKVEANHGIPGRNQS